MNRFVQALYILSLAGLLAGCPKKDDAAAKDSAAPTAATSASSTTPTASDTSTTTTATTDTGESAFVAPPTGAPEVVADPNAPPSHDDHDKAAMGSIQKNNYKSELDKLEKEDLNSMK